MTLHIGEHVFHFAGARHEHRRPHHRRHVAAATRAQPGQDRFGVHRPHNVVERFAGDGIARPAGRRHAVRGLFQRQVGGKRDHRGARRHHVAGALLAELEHALEQTRVFLAERAGAPALLHEHADLLGRMHAVDVGGGALDPQQLDDAVGAPVEQVGHRAGDPGKENQRRGDPAARPFGIRDRPRFRRLLAEHDVQERDHRERHR